MPWKNRLEIEVGVSLTQQAVDCARGSGVCDHIVVSTDCPADLPVSGALVSQRPIDLSGPTSDISDTVRYETQRMERLLKTTFDWVVTLQPAVLARSPLIVRRLVESCEHHQAGGGITMASIHPWVWTGGDSLSAPWLPGPYPRSQDSPPSWQEINAVQVCRRSLAMEGKRWGSPLCVLELPSWSCALDVDTPDDLKTARDMWPFARRQLETWSGTIRCLPVVNV